MEDFTDQVVVITGAASGIGSALTEAFAQQSARLMIADIPEEFLRAIEERVRNMGVEVLAVRTDVANSASVDALAQATLKTFGEVHVLCNNAGGGKSMRPVWDVPLEFWHEFLDIDYWG